MGRVTHYDTVQMLAHLLSQRENVAKYYVTVTAGQTHTLRSLGIAAGKSAVVTWGDGLSNEYTGTAARTHVYVSAGTYAVKIYTPENVTTFDLRDGAAVSVLNSADISGLVNVSTFQLFNLTNATGTLNSSDMVDWLPSTFHLVRLANALITINSADMVDWRPDSFSLNGLANASITFNSADCVDWRPDSFSLNGLANASITFNSADCVDWRPSTFNLYNLPSATITLNSSDMVDWRPSGTFNLYNLPNATISLNSSDIVDWRPSTFQLFNLTNATGTLNSADMVDWRPSTFYLHTLPNATVTLNSSDMVDWRPGSLTLHTLSTATVTLNSSDMVDWRPGSLTLNNIPNATITITPSSIKNWSTAATIDLRTGNLTQAQANLVLWECYQIQRTVTGGAIRLNIGGNSAPSGTFQPCQSPPVSASTPGKEIAYELLNDSLGVGFNKWATVTTN